MALQWDTLFADRTTMMKRSTVREILKLTAQPDMISFAGGLPAPEFFPEERVKAAADLILTERSREALQYSTTEGMPELRQLIAERLATSSLTVTADNILITTGSQQALDLIGRVMLNDHDRIIVENPTYLGMLSAWRPYALDYRAVPTDEGGMQVDALESLLLEQPKMIYSVPTFQNPAGTTLSTERRRQLVALLAAYAIPMVEDNPYGELRYSGEATPLILGLDAEHLGINELNGHVIYAGTFSKVLAPGLRVGWVAAALPVIDKLVQAKQSTDLHSSTLDQFITYEVARNGFLDAHILRLREVYRERRDIMLVGLEEHFPPEVKWTRPEGGLFLMITLPESMNSLELLTEALKHKVAFVPGTDFHIGGTGHNTFRLNFSNARPEMIAAGVQRLGSLLKDVIVQS